MLSNKIYPLLLLLVTVLFSACSDDDDNMDMNNDKSMNIVELAQSDDDFSSLVAAVQKVGLASTLSGEGEFTVFAPSNAAFEDFLSANGFAELDDVPNDVLEQILLNHVLGQEVKSADISTGYQKNLASFGSTSSNLNIYLNTSSGVVINGDINVTAADLDASNGVVHKVDKVIALPTITTFAAADPTFSILVQALTRSDLSANYAETLTGDGPFTVFAPTNDAFADLLTELNASELSDIDAATLESTLLYHVVSGANVLASDLTDGQSVITIEGSDFTINLTGGASITDANSRESNIIVTDVQAANGVIHVINKVLLN